MLGKNSFHLLSRNWLLGRCRASAFGSRPAPSSTFLFLQEVNGPLQYCGLVHLERVAVTLQHRAKLFNEDIELVSPLLFRFVA